MSARAKRQRARATRRKPGRKNRRLGTPSAAHGIVEIKPGARTRPPRSDHEGRRALGRKILRGALRLGVVSAVVFGAMAGAEHAYDYALTSPRFETANLVYEPTAHVDAQRLRTLLDIDPHTNILSLDMEALAAAVATDPWVRRAEVIRELPDTLIVTVEEHEPVAVMMSGDFFLVDEHGVPFKRLEAGERGDLPVISGVDRKQWLSTPAQAARSMTRALDTLAAYRRRGGPKLSEIHVGPSGEVVLYTAARGTQLRLGRGDVEHALDRLETLRVAMGQKFEGLAVVHLDGAEPSGPDRVVARLFEEAAVVAVAPESSDEPDSDDKTSSPAAAARHDWTRHGPRIPRYD